MEEEAAASGALDSSAAPPEVPPGGMDQDQEQDQAETKNGSENVDAATADSGSKRTAPALVTKREKSLTEEVFEIRHPRKRYLLKDQFKNFKQQEDACKKSCFVYLGNLSFFTNEQQIHGLFSMSGDVVRVIMGLNKTTRKPCGFAFVEFSTHKDAAVAKRAFDGSTLDERVIKVEIDPGFTEGRQYGRGNKGGQVRDEMRHGYDAHRGGEGGALGMQMQGGRDRRGGGGRGGMNGALSAPRRGWHQPPPRSYYNHRGRGYHNDNIYRRGGRRDNFYGRPNSSQHHHPGGRNHNYNSDRTRRFDAPAAEREEAQGRDAKRRRTDNPRFRRGEASDDDDE